jgi:hypothetical protein
MYVNQKGKTHELDFHLAATMGLSPGTSSFMTRTLRLKERKKEKVYLEANKLKILIDILNLA